MAGLGAAAAQLLSVPAAIAISDAVCTSSSSGSSRRKPLLLLKLRRCGLSSCTSWDGHLHLHPRQMSSLFEVWDRRRSRGSKGVVQASLLGVGAPEALVIAVVALVVFGPRGLAEVARTIGKSLRAFQPTIQELQQVSREFKNTLEQEIGLEELRNPSSTPPKASTPAPPSAPAGVTAESAIPQSLDSPATAAATAAEVVPETVNPVSLPSLAAILNAKPPQSIEEQPPQNASPEALLEQPQEFSGAAARDALRKVEEQLNALKAKLESTVAEEQRLEAERAAWGGKTPTQLKLDATSPAPPPHAAQDVSQL